MFPRTAWVLVLGACCAALVGCAADSSLNARLAGAEQLAREANQALKDADQRMRAEQLDEAGELLVEVREKVEDRQMAFYADRENLEDRLSQANSRLAAARDAKHRREIAQAVPGRIESCDALLAEFRSSADALRDRAALDRPKTTRARSALEAARRFLEDSKAFEIDSKWTAYAAGARKELAGRQVQVTLAEAVVAFLEGPVAKNQAAKALFEKAKAEKKAEDRPALIAQARDSWLACGKDAAALLAQNPGLEREPMPLGAPKLTPKTFAAACEAQAKAADGIANPPPKPAGKAPAAKKAAAKK